MRALLLIGLFALTTTAEARTVVAAVGAPREVLSAVEKLPETSAGPLRGKVKTVAQALRRSEEFDLLIWVRAKGKSVTAELYSSAGKPLGFVKVKRAKRSWSAASVAELASLVSAHLKPAPAPEPVLSAPEPVVAAAPEPVADTAPKPTRSEASRPKPPPLAPPAPPAALALRLDVPMLEVALGSDVVWRSYELCPGTIRCGRQVFTSPAGLRFITEAPYVGGTVGLTSFPFQGEDSALDGVGVDARYARRFIEVAVPTDAGLTFVPSYDEELWAELLYRAPAAPFGLDAWHGVRIGGGTRRFVSSEDATSSSSLRGLGATFGLDAGLALLGPWLRAEAALSYVFGSNPGAPERSAYGGAVVGSDSLRGRATLSGTFGTSGFGYGLSADYTLFLDSFFGQGGRSNGGTAREEYLTVSASLRYRL